MEKYFSKGIDLIISDVAPTTSGIKFQDYTASLELCNRTLNIALNILNKGGILILKIFQGKDIELFNKQVKKRFLNYTEEDHQEDHSFSVKTSVMVFLR